MNYPKTPRDVHCLSRSERLSLIDSLLCDIQTPDLVVERLKKDPVFRELMRAHPHKLPKSVSGEWLSDASGLTALTY